MKHTTGREIKANIIVFILIFLIGCTGVKKTPNYKIINGHYSIWRYSKVGELKMDILSSGDTLISSNDTFYIKKRLP